MSAPDNELTFYYDFSSPYAYLGATQVERVAGEAGAFVRWRPILVGALFNAIGTPNVPLDEAPAAKRSYMLRDLMHWASHWGVKFRWPTRFPMRTVAPLRMVYAAEAAGGDVAALSHAIFRAYWVENRDIADPAVLATLGEIAGIDAPAVKAALRSATDEAIAAGVCGVPSFVARGQLFWGQDRLELVSRTLGGWRPPML
ncbi:MAG TPA: 2-hydroxychromene-2-carboxylate isomerase [Polyangia bacterium]|jgi:2-hydroxychromene-2-carboxylate isomerase